MKFFLMRHCQAVDGEQLDVERVLTKKGKAQIKVVGDFLESQSDKISTVLCSSDLKRGIETGEGLAKILDADLIQSPLVDPPNNAGTVTDADIKALWKLIQKTAKDIDGELLVVSHGPLINATAAWLIGSDEGTKFHYSHGAVSRWDTETPDDYEDDGRGEGVVAFLHWFASVKMMLRAMEQDESAAVEEALRIADAMLGEARGDYTYEEVLLKRSVLGDGGAAGNCDTCDDCADQGWIDSEDVFESGEDEPPHHPNCSCGVEYKESRKRVYA